MEGYLGFGRQTTDSDPAPVTRYYRFVPDGHDICEDCDQIRPHAVLELVDSDENGVPLYRCLGGACRPGLPRPDALGPSVY